MNLPHLRIISESGSSVTTRIELDGVDITQKLVGLKLSCIPGEFWRATCDLVCTVDAETKVWLEAHTDETRRHDSEEAQRKHIHDAVETLVLAVESSEDAERLYAMRDRALGWVVSDRVADATPINGTVREYVAVKDQS